MSTPTQPHKRDFFEGNTLSLPAAEERILTYWRESDIFHKSLSRSAAKLKNTPGRGRTFVFYEGPPSANGLPGIHHVLARVYKDIILRYRTMRGYNVPRKSGWDTHGLPVEIAAEKALNLASKKDIEGYGIAPFNEKCRELVWGYKKEWDWVTERIGYWLDLEHPYITFQNSYMESLWWILSRIHSKGLFYQGYKIVNWCTRCGTSLSSHELAQGYRETVDTSVYVKFRLSPNQKVGEHVTDGATYILSWTTTPWTLPGNVALAVGEAIDYAIVKDSTGDYYIVAVALLQKALAGREYEVIGKVKGKKLLGLSYEPLFAVPFLQSDTSYKVYGADFVTTTDGTGVVHTAVMYGEDDYKLGVAVGLPQAHTVDESGRFVEGVPGLAGLRAKSKDGGENQKTEELIFNHLREKNALLATEKYTHEYPFCWRCDTPLLYYARSSWFIGMSKLRKELNAGNKTIHWVPQHIQNGRFGEWLKEAKDWNFSRERYWGTPIPLWSCDSCKYQEMLSGGAQLHERMGGAKNSYLMMRHGFPETLIVRRIDSGSGQYHLTPRGIAQVKKEAARLKRAGITKIISSPVLRCKETSKILSEVLNLPVKFDDRLREINLGVLEGHRNKEYDALFPTYQDRLDKAPEGGESLKDVKSRAWSLLSELESRYAGEKFLLVSHEYTIWAYSAAAAGWDDTRMIAEKKKRDPKTYIQPAEVRSLELLVGPRDARGNYDLHRPYVDACTYSCPKCKQGTMRRIPEVADVWFDSGSMPLAQFGYPHQTVGGTKVKPTVAVPFPADYICEAIDQTRGWFYTLLAVATALGLPAPYKNVICLGHINDKTGKKMSKSKGNIVWPRDIIEKYGTDALRWYMYTATDAGDPKNFDEAELAKAFRRYHLMLWNSLLFWETYADRAAKIVPAQLSVLDRWILARLAETSEAATKRLESYEVRAAALELERLVDDLSRWYIRRSRRRLQKPESAKDLAAASATLKMVLVEFSKLTAPFTPFFAEGMYTRLTPSAQSVHLDFWPAVKKLDAGQKRILSEMQKVRDLASLGLAARQEAGVKVRQPLSKLVLPDTRDTLKDKALLSILADEVNVKEIVFSKKIKKPVLDTTITPELKEEGLVRDLIRATQELRGDAKLKPSDRVNLHLAVSQELLTIYMKWEKTIKAETGAKVISSVLPKAPQAIADYPEGGADGKIAITKIK